MNNHEKESSINRRDFLKLASITPALYTGLSTASGGLKLAPAHGNSPNILILVFDALSANHLPLYGYERNTAPNVTRFAEQATVYREHYASGSFTSPATASIFTGTYPWSHRAFNLHGTMADEFAVKNLFSLLPSPFTQIVYSHNLLVTSLLEQFREELEIFKHTRDLSLVDEQYSDRIFPRDSNASFWSEALILRGGETKPSSLFLSLFYKIMRLASKRRVTRVYGELFPRGVPNLNDVYFVLEDAIDWLKEVLATAPKPYLGYFHFLPPHEPYLTRRDFVNVFQDGFTPLSKPEHAFTEGHSEKALKRERREYDEFIAYADAEFGRLLDFLVQSGIADDTCIILTSDHGEMFERGIRGHVTQTLYEPVIRVPLLIRMPGQTKREDVTTPTSCVDLLPTLLHLSGQEIPAWCEGQVLPNFQEAPVNNSERSIFAVEAKSSPKYGPLRKGTFVLRKGNYKLIEYVGYQKHQLEPELYDLAQDPEELESLSQTAKLVVEELRAELQSKLQSVNERYK